MFALRAMKDDALAPLNCAITMRPLLGPKVSNNKDDCENVAVHIVGASPFITIEQRSSVGAGNEMTSESYDGTSENSTGIMGTLDVSKEVDAVEEVTNMKLVIAKAFMSVEAPFDATVVLDSQIEPMSTCLDSLTLISNGEHIKAFLGRFEQNRNNEHEASHFYNFVGPSTRIHRFSVPSEGVPLLEHLRIRHNDFIE
nr:hypothetical protein CFP56_15883 [Quercus suber]